MQKREVPFSDDVLAFVVLVFAKLPIVPVKLNNELRRTPGARLPPKSAMNEFLKYVFV